MGIPHTHERVEWSSVWNVEFTFQDKCSGHCAGYCDRPSSENESAGLDGGCVTCDQDLD